MSARLLIATAVNAERDAILAGLGTGAEHVSVAAVGVGPAAAAAGTARLLALAEAGGTPYPLVVCAGIAGGFADRVRVGGVVLATRSVAADLGAASPDGFLPLDELGFGGTPFDADPTVLAALRAALPQATAGSVLTVSTVTGTAPAAAELVARYPDAVAEAMEGYGVACAAALSGTGFAELRAISNLVGFRDRAAWRVREALIALAAAAPALAAVTVGEWLSR
ncbi:MAG TPA: futalosine hydrolase [Micromonosporaceae bacterium]|jgi:futalosine hydrolase|nr:futalosine hydrolase [Micromonosporaceae bacterium]